MEYQSRFLLVSSITPNHIPEITGYDSNRDEERMGHQIEFSEEEQEYILTHIGPGPQRQSWGQIADYLNKEFFEYNKGKRKRNSIYRWVNEYIRNYAAIMTRWNGK